MWRLVLTVSLLCCSSEGSVTCRDENNGEVDWYILYKTPRIKDKGLTGLDYIYIYPDRQNKATPQRNDNNKKINDPEGVLANTLQPLFDFKEDTPSQDFGFISYSDQPPDCSASPSFGHSKGVVMVEKNRKGVWLLHSTPKFPNDREPNNFWPESGASYAQTFICVTFNYDQFKRIGKHLQRIKAFPFDYHIPSDFHVELKEAKNKQQRNYNTLNIIKFPAKLQLLTSSEGKDFYSIAKQRSSGPRVGDLYYSIALNKEVNSSVYVQTWGGQPGHKDPPGRSFCPTNGKKVENIESVKIDNRVGWTAGNDHSKWCVAVDQNKPWTCIADVNRAKSQYKRLGGALCVKDAEIHRIFKNFVKDVEECPNPGQKRHGSNVVTGVKQKKSNPGK